MIGFIQYINRHKLSTNISKVKLTECPAHSLSSQKQNPMQFWILFHRRYYKKTRNGYVLRHVQVDFYIDQQFNNTNARVYQKTGNDKLII